MTRLSDDTRREVGADPGRTARTPGPSGGGVGGRRWRGRLGLRDRQAGVLTAAVGVALGCTAGLQAANQDVVLSVAAGETYRVQQETDALVVQQLQMDDGAVLLLTEDRHRAATIVIESMTARGTTTIKVDANNDREGPRHLWLLDGGQGVLGTLVVDVSGRHGANSGQRAGNGGTGQSGAPIVVNLVFAEGGYAVADRIAEGDPLLPGRLRVVSRGGRGGEPGPSYDPRSRFERLLPRPGGYRLRSGRHGSGGNGGDVRLRLLWAEESVLQGQYGEREVGSGDWARIADRLGVEIDVAPGSGPGEPKSGRIDLEFGCVGKDKRDRSAGAAASGVSVETKGTACYSLPEW